MQKDIKELLKKIIKDKYSIVLDDIDLRVPPKKDLGDFCFNCGVLSRDLKKNPNIISTELVEVLKGDILEEVSVSGAYINIKIDRAIFTMKFFELLDESSISVNTKKNIVIDYIGTNVGKPLHIGHMCTPNQGQVIINIYKKLGYNTISDSHIGDWGIIFGKLIKAYKLWGDEIKLKEDAVNHLFELYVKATSESKINPDMDDEYRKEFKKLSLGDKASVKLWESFTKESIVGMNKQLCRLNIKPDFNIGESFYEGLNLPKMENYPDLKYNMNSIVDELIEKKIATKNEDNSVGIIFDDNLKLSSCILQKRDGTHGYLASDLASIKYRVENWSPEKIIYFTDVRQQLHFKQVFATAEKAGWISSGKLKHAYNGFISLKDGAMSTREGKIIKLDKLLDESILRAKAIIVEKRNDLTDDELNEIATKIGIGAIKYGYLKKSRESDIIFDWDEFMTFEGNSGPYIQYAYVRGIRILEKNNALSDSVGKNIKKSFDKNIFFDQKEEVELIKQLLNYKQALLEVSSKNMPHILCGYSYDLTKAFSSFYNNIHILSEENQAKKDLRIILVTKFLETLKESFELLGIDMPEKM